LHYLPRIPAMLTGRAFSLAPFDGFYKDKYLAMTAHQAAFVYSLISASRARCIVEFGSSLGVSTIWLALAARANWGKVITTEIVPEKAAQTRANLEEAGLADVVDIRVGDASQTLQDLDEPVDFLLSDGFPTKALEVLQLVHPLLVPGATVVTHNVATFSANYRPYLDWIRDPAHGYVSTTVPFKSGTEVSVYGGPVEH
jgi:predicted O-methyltransferase YrrM